MSGPTVWLGNTWGREGPVPRGGLPVLELGCYFHDPLSYFTPITNCSLY